MSKEQEETVTCALVTMPVGPSELVPVPQLELSRFTKSEKWFIVGLVAFVGFFRQIFIMSSFELFETDSITAH